MLKALKVRLYPNKTQEVQTDKHWRETWVKNEF